MAGNKGGKKTAAPSTPTPKQTTERIEEENTEKNLSFTAEQVKHMMKLHEETIFNVIKMTEERMERKLQEVRKEASLNDEKLRKEIEELKKSLSFTDNNNQEIKTHVKVLEQNQNDSCFFFEEKLSEAEDRSRRNNIRFDNIDEEDGTEDESWAESEGKVMEVLEQIGVSGVNIERAHRIGKKRIGKKRTIIARFLNYKEKQLVLRKYKEHKLWNENIYVNEDFSERTLQIRKDLFKEAKDIRARGGFARVSYKTLIKTKRQQDTISDSS